MWADFGGKVYHLVEVASSGDETLCKIPLNTANGVTSGGRKVPWLVEREPKKPLCKCCSKQRRSTGS